MRRSLSNVARAEWSILAELLTSARTEAGLSQSELARRLGRKQGYIWKIENSLQRIDPLELYDICLRIGVPAEGVYEAFVKRVQAIHDPGGSPLGK